MKHFLIITLLVFCVSCGNERILQLPEIQNSEITKITDVSPAYIFYDETKKDSVELNRKNLIITTNWLVNVDKRLSLKQAMPSIILLQNKKRNAEMHKNEEARNYFTCNATAIKNLGFIDFTDVIYLQNKSVDLNINSKVFHLMVFNSNKIQFTTADNRILTPNKEDLARTINTVINTLETDNNLLTVGFDESLSFQDYITIKSELLKLNSERIKINKHEFIFN